MAIDDIQSSLRRRRETARILIDQSPIDAMVEKDRALAALIASDDSLGANPEIARLDAEVKVLEQAIIDAEREFVFQGIGRQAWTKLIADHPRSADEEAAGIDVGEEFTLHAIAASCENRDLTVDDARWLYNELDEGEWAKLWAACLTANYGTMMRPKSVAASALRSTSVPSWLTARLEAFREASS